MNQLYKDYQTSRKMLQFPQISPRYSDSTAYDPSFIDPNYRLDRVEKMLQSQNQQIEQLVHVLETNKSSNKLSKSSDDQLLYELKKIKSKINKIESNPIQQQVPMPYPFYPPQPQQPLYYPVYYYVPYPQQQQQNSQNEAKAYLQNLIQKGKIKIIDKEQEKKKKRKKKIPKKVLPPPTPPQPAPQPDPTPEPQPKFTQEEMKILMNKFKGAVWVVYICATELNYLQKQWVKREKQQQEIYPAEFQKYEPETSQWIKTVIQKFKEEAQRKKLHNKDWSFTLSKGNKLLVQVRYALEALEIFVNSLGQLFNIISENHLSFMKQFSKNYAINEFHSHFVTNRIDKRPNQKLNFLNDLQQQMILLDYIYINIFVIGLITQHQWYTDNQKKKLDVNRESFKIIISLLQQLYYKTFSEQVPVIQEPLNKISGVYKREFSFKVVFDSNVEIATLQQFENYEPEFVRSDKKGIDGLNDTVIYDKMGEEQSKFEELRQKFVQFSEELLKLVNKIN